MGEMTDDELAADARVEASYPTELETQLYERDNEVHRLLTILEEHWPLIRDEMEGEVQWLECGNRECGWTAERADQGSWNDHLLRLARL